MKLVAISDTHNMHDKIVVPSGDICIHAGDATGRGWEHEVRNFIKWYSKVDCEHKIYVPGNHDIGLEKNYDEWSTWFTDAGITILNDESVIIEGVSTHDFKEYKIKIHGSPITPNFGHWAFMRARGEQINKHWMQIPGDVDILVTHGPPNGILDEVYNMWDEGQHTGCEMLWRRILQVKPKIHIFGHIHEGAGSFQMADTEFINASQLDECYSLAHKPMVRHL